ncbi:MAG: Rad52/Rad22 family DNA repair protein [Gemmatimonadota bacterium]|nr:Rad52/Rad22 family DNA repair protein [Gemmatimonadota bacterium]
MIARQDSFSTRDEVWAALAAPVPAKAISWRQDGKPVARNDRHFARFVCYIEANTVRERLDTVVPGEWDLTLDMLPQLHGSDDSDSACAFKARLQVLGVIREDVGTGRDYKQAATDAFKRAAVRFGIGNELYSYEQNWVEVDGDGKFAKPVEDPAAAYERRHATRTGKPVRSALFIEDGGNAEPTVLKDVDAVSCPKCGGRMWDNRLTKRNPKAPDYKCRDRGCDGAVWPANGGDGVTAPVTATLEQAQPELDAAATRKQRPAKLVTDDEIPF